MDVDGDGAAEVADDAEPDEAQVPEVPSVSKDVSINEK